MFNKIKSFFQRIEIRPEYIYLPVKDIDLMREQLGSIKLSDTEEEMTEQERREYCAAIFAVYPRLEKDIKRFLYKQLEESIARAETWEQVIFGKGTFNGMVYLMEKWKQANDEHIASVPPGTKFNPHNPLIEINE